MADFTLELAPGVKRVYVGNSIVCRWKEGPVELVEGHVVGVDATASGGQRVTATIVNVQRRFGEDGMQTCRECGCTDVDCSGCIERTGRACSWVETDLCSACAEVPRG